MKTIFVSSTFKDMQYERDAIREITAPRVNEKAREFGDEIDFCDLRWGINTGDLDTVESSKKVLDVCLDEIDRCESPMVVLLGERYGWIPEADLIKTAAERKKLELDDLERSITALEIEYGALCPNHKFQNTLFYFRKIEVDGELPSDYRAEDALREEKIAVLKKRIEEKTGVEIQYYTLKWNGNGFDGVKEFAEKLADDIATRLMCGWKELKDLTPFGREMMVHDSFIRAKGSMFKARQSDAEKLKENILLQPVTIIKGGVGIGKSTLFCHLATELKNELDKTEWKVLTFIAGLTTESSSAADIIEKTIYFVEEELHIDHFEGEMDFRFGAQQRHTPEERRIKLADRCFEYANTGKKLIIMLDAADQLTPSEERDQMHFIPTSVPENIHFVMTCTEKFDTSGIACDPYMLKPIGDDENKRAVISGTLARSGRELSDSVINEILTKKASAAKNPLYLSLLVQRLLMMNRDDFMAIRHMGDDMSAIEKRQKELIGECPDNLDEMGVALLNEAGKRINEKLVSKIAEYLAVSRNGLRKKDLAALLGGEWTEVDFSHFTNYMNDCFLRKDDGRYDFMHKSVREGFYNQCKDRAGVNRELLDYFKGLEANDPVRMSELIYHTIRADDRRFLIDCIAEYESKDDQSYLYCAARDIHAQCIADNGKWMIDVLNEVKKYKADETLVYLSIFCNFELSKVFLGSQKELEIGLSIMTANVYLSLYLYQELKNDRSGISDGCERNLAISYHNVGRIYEELGGIDCLEKALKCYSENLAISKRRFEQVGKVDDSGNLAISRENTAAVERLRDLAISYETIGTVCERLGDIEHLNLALSYHNGSLKIRQYQVDKVVRTPESLRDLSVSYGKVAGVYNQYETRESLEQARKLYQEELEICKQLIKMGGAGSKNDLIITCIHAAEVYKKLGGEENMQLAMELNQEALATSRQLARTSDNLRLLSVSHMGVAEIYKEQGGRKNLEEALKQANAGFELSEQLVERAGTAESMRDFSASCLRIAPIYRELGGKENLERALSLCENAIAIGVQLDGNARTAENLRDLSAGCNNAAEICMELGDKENLKRALELYYDGYQISWQLANVQQISPTYYDSAVSMYNIAKHPFTSESERQTMLNNALELAQSLYEQTDLNQYKILIAKCEELIEKK